MTYLPFLLVEATEEEDALAACLIFLRVHV
jgi:hypothetical protein